jgi:CRISPR-associated protein Csb2
MFAALTESCWKLSGRRRLPLCLHGPNIQKNPDWKHEHAFVLPEDADGFIDHISIAAAMGLDPAALRLLVTTDRLVLSNGHVMDLVPQEMGRIDQVGHTGAAKTWISRTAYVPPNVRRTGPRDAAKQLGYETAKRQLPKLVAKPAAFTHIDCGGERLTPDLFHLECANGETRSPNSAFFFKLEFEQPVRGPLAFGWSCHRGLGQFVPAPPSHAPLRLPASG